MSVSFPPHDESWKNSVPNKLFDCLAAGLAIVTSDGQPAARIVTESVTGVVYIVRDPDSLVTAVASLVDPAVRVSCVANGRAAFEQRYNWGTDAARLLVSLHAVIMQKKCPA